MFLSPRAHVLDNPAKKERRSWNRIPVQIQVFCQNVQGEDELCWSARVTDICRGGVKLSSPHKFEPGTVVRIGEADGFEELSRLLHASVVRAQRSPGEQWTLGCALTKELSEAELLAWIGRNRQGLNKLLPDPNRLGTTGLFQDPGPNLPRDSLG